MIPTPTLRHVFDVAVTVGKPIELGQGRGGARRIIPITGGTVRGQIRGEVLPIGADWQTTQADGAFHLHARYPIRTDDGAVIEVINTGTRAPALDSTEGSIAGTHPDPALQKMRTTARLETGDSRYDWVNNAIFVAAGARRVDRVEIAFYRVE